MAWIEEWVVEHMGLCDFKKYFVAPFCEHLHRDKDI